MDTVAVHAEELPEPARSVGWEKFKAASPGFASYEEKTDRTFPIFKLAPGRDSAERAEQTFAATVEWIDSVSLGW